jgi:peroxiredoxin
MKKFRIYQRILNWKCGWCWSIAAVLVVVPVGLSWFMNPGHAPALALVDAHAAASVPAKDFQLKDLDGSLVRLSDYKGKQAVLLYFWATWCPSCVAVKPQVAKLRADLSRDSLEILGVNVGTGDTLEKLLQYQKGHPASYPILYDDGGKVSRAYQIQGIPLFILIDKEGAVVYRDHQLPANIQKYLAAK